MPALLRVYPLHWGIRQFYYWYTPEESAPDGTRKSLVLVSYASGQAESYWRPLQEGQPFDQSLGTNEGPNFSPIEQNMDANIVTPMRGGPRHASVTMAMEAHRQLMEVHGIEDIIGECYSDVQGWVQGALNTAEALAQCNWRMKWGPWLDKNKWNIWLGPGTKWISPGDPTDDPCLPIDSPVDS